MPNMPHAIRQISKFRKVEKAKTLVNALFGCFVGQLVILFKIENIHHKTPEMIDKNNELIHQIKFISKSLLNSTCLRSRA